MTGYLPDLLPDELLYSLLARLARHRGVPADGAFMSELFGRRHAVAAFDLPGGLGEFAARIDPARGLDADALAEQATLLPFVTAFMPEDVRAMARRGMAGSTAGLHLMLGLAAFRIASPRSLRFCPDCWRDMERSRGERWWRRAHQLPGIVVCPEHGTPLRESGVTLDAGARHRFTAADDVDEAAVPAAIAAADPDARRLLQELAVAAAALLDAPPASETPTGRAVGYRRQLREVGLMRSAAKVDLRALEREFVAYWGAALASIPGLGRPGTPGGAWLAALVRHRPRAAHPVCHLLLRLFLASRVPVAPPFGIGPWECLNPAADHYGRAVVTDLTVRRDRTMAYGDFACTCGYVYTRSLDPAGAIGRPRFRTFGPTLEPALRRALGEGCGLREAARRLGLDPKTLMREAAQAGVPLPWRTRPSGRIGGTNLATPRVVPKRVAGDHRTRSGVRATRDWNLIDRRLAKSVDAATRAVHAEHPPTRITFAEIERRVARRGWIGKRRGKLPLTSATIDRVAETREAFRGRRLAATIATLVEAGRPFSPSEALRAAGLPMGWLPRVRSEVAEALRGAHAGIPLARTG